VPSVLLATFPLLPDGEYGGHHLLSALADRGVDARWASWDDPAVDWAAADLVAVRSTWDYHRRCADFLAWARAVERDTLLLNGAAVFAWNADKAYLAELARHVPVVPSEPVDDAGLVAGLRSALDRFGTIVVKAATGAGGVGVVVATRTDDERLAGLTAGPWIVQPLVESVRTRGETSVFVLGGRAVSQVDKIPAAGEIRVHEQFGGVSRPVPLGEEPARVAVAAMEAVEGLLGRPLDYGRVDLLEYDGHLVVGEVELIEPGLYLDVFPALAESFADLLVGRLAERTDSPPRR
jgi:glutathione synthase/RimK-type ligase-like ATP-grasp enzyme